LFSDGNVTFHGETGMTVQSRFFQMTAAPLAPSEGVEVAPRHAFVRSLIVSATLGQRLVSFQSSRSNRR
jgi:hypothetical protein